MKFFLSWLTCQNSIMRSKMVENAKSNNTLLKSSNSPKLFNVMSQWFYTRWESCHGTSRGSSNSSKRTYLVKCRNVWSRIFWHLSLLTVPLIDWIVISFQANDFVRYERGRIRQIPNLADSEFESSEFEWCTKVWYLMQSHWSNAILLIFEYQ